MTATAAAKIHEKNSATATIPALAKLLAAFRRDLHPVTFTEDLLVQAMARSFHSALRAISVETNLINAQITAIADHPSILAYAKKQGSGFHYDTLRLGQAFESDQAHRGVQPKLTRAIATHDQAFLRAQTSLQKLQAQK